MRLTLNEINYIMQETCNRLMLLEISNNAIETLLKKYNPQFVNLMDKTIKELDNWDMVQLPPQTTTGRSMALRSIPQYAGRIILSSLGVTDTELRQYPNMKIKDYMRLKLLKEFQINRGQGPIKYLRGIIRICCDNNEGINFFTINHAPDKRLLKKFRQIINHIYTNNLEFNEDLNGLTLVQLNKMVGAKMRVSVYQEWLANRKQEEELQDTFGEYKVIPINSHEEASRYAKYTAWCVTHSQGNYDGYTGDGSRFFFCLKNGFENVVKQRGEGCPLDEYGLSMVSVLIRQNGTVKHITTRWNHDNEGEDNPNLNTLEQVEQILGIPEDVFLADIAPAEFESSDVEELINQGIDIGQFLKKGQRKGDMYEVYFESDARKRNVMKDGKLLLKDWYSAIVHFDGRYFRCRREIGDYSCMENLCDENGAVFPNDIHYILIDIFDEDKEVFNIKSYEKNKHNLIKKGETAPLLPRDIKTIYGFHQGICLVDEGGRQYNFINENFEFLWETPNDLKIPQYLLPKSWNNGVLRIERDGYYTYYDIYNNRLLTSELFLSVEPFGKHIGLVSNEKGRNFVKRNGELVSDEWFRGSVSLENGYINCRMQGESLLISNKGDVIMKAPYREFNSFNGRYGCATKKSGLGLVIFDAEGNELYTIKDAEFGEVYDDKFLVTGLDGGLDYDNCILYDINGNALTNKLLIARSGNRKTILFDEQKQIYYLADDINHIFQKFDNNDDALSLIWQGI